MIDLGLYLLDADDRCVTLHRKTVRKNAKTGVETPATDVIGHFATFAQAAARLAHMSAADAVAAGYNVDRIRQSVDDAATRIENAIHNVRAVEMAE
jgi:ABC-type sulfate/molybdate transport systems ATPase subunit